MVRRHATLVAPEKMDTRPVDKIAKSRRGQPAIKRLRGRATGERDGKAPRAHDGILGEGDELRRGFAVQFIPILAKDDLALSHRIKTPRNRRRRAAPLVRSARLAREWPRAIRHNGLCR